MVRFENENGCRSSMHGILLLSATCRATLDIVHVFKVCFLLSPTLGQWLPGRFLKVGGQRQRPIIAKYFTKKIYSFAKRGDHMAFSDAV